MSLNRMTPQEAAQAIVDSMHVSGTSEFNGLLTTCQKDAAFQTACKNGLIQMARGPLTADALKAIQLLGVLRVVEAETELAGVLEREFPQVRLVSDMRTIQHRAIVDVLVALSLINQNKWI